jgi:MFS family permease
LWAWQITGSATALSLVAAFSFAPLFLLSPIAGVLVDRWNRKLVMLLGDLAAGTATIVVLLLYTTGKLQIWHLFITGACAGVFQSLQWPAYSAAISTMVPKAQYGRANGMLSLAESAAGIGAPLLAGVLVGILGISGILIIDIITFCLAIMILLIIHIPQPPTSAESHALRGSFRQEVIYGFRYIFTRPGLLGIQMILLASNLVTNFATVVITPMILARTANNATLLGTVLAAGSFGTLLGGMCMSTWGGPKRRIHGVLLGCALSGLLGILVMGLGRSLPVWAFGAFIGLFFAPIISGSNQAIWQTKVALDVQGRVFAARRLIAAIAIPIAMFLAGPVADYIFEPAMRSNSAFANAFEPVVGVGPGAGMSVMMVISGALLGVIGLAGYCFRAIQNVEIELPDYDHVAA